MGGGVGSCPRERFRHEGCSSLEPIDKFSFYSRNFDGSVLLPGTHGLIVPGHSNNSATYT